MSVLVTIAIDDSSRRDLEDVAARPDSLEREDAVLGRGAW